MLKSSNSHINKLKSGTKNATVVTLKLSSNLTGDSKDEVNFTYGLLLPNTQPLKTPNAFPNSQWSNNKLSKIQLSKMIQSG